MIALQVMDLNESGSSSSPSILANKQMIRQDTTTMQRVPSRENLRKRLWRALRHGPEQPTDNFPTFHRKWAMLRILDDGPLIYRSRIPNWKVRITLLIVYCCIWFVVCLRILYPTFIAVPYYKTKGGPKQEVVALSCSGQWNWSGKNNLCGLNAEDCSPFEDEDVILKCPALCDRGSWVYAAMAVGKKNVKYSSYTIGGGRKSNVVDDILTEPYRGDSYACGSALHAGLISRASGGCVKLSMSGAQNAFPSSKGRNGIGTSVGFDSFFPSSFQFRKLQGATYGCEDPRFPFTVTNILFSLPVFYAYETPIGFWILIIAGYWNLILALDPPVTIDPSYKSTLSSLWSVGFERLLPLCFILYVLWRVSIRKTDGAPPLLKVVFWFPLFWLGLLNNVTFDRLPVDRLTPKDLKELAGALAAVIFLFVAIIICICFQAYSLWKAGKLIGYVKLYLGMVVGLVVLGVLPGLNLRIHHYILGIILLPGCATRGISAFMFQGVLVGLIISGAGRWGYASIVETAKALSRGEAGFSPLPPIFQFNSSTPHAVSWILDEKDKPHKDLNGYSLLINDVEYYSGTNTTVDLDVLQTENDVFAKLLDDSLRAKNGNVTLYMRVGRVSTKDKYTRGDYTNAAVLQWPEGIWFEPEPGVT